MAPWPCSLPRPPWQRRTIVRSSAPPLTTQCLSNFEVTTHGPWQVFTASTTAMLRSVDPAEVAVLVATYLDREGYAATAKQFQQDASVLLARVAPPAGRVKDLQTVVSGYIRAHSLLAVPVGIARFVRHDRPGAFVLGGAALLFVLRVRQLRRRAARLAEAKAQAEINGELQEEPSWLEEAAARLRDTQE